MQPLVAALQPVVDPALDAGESMVRWLGAGTNMTDRSYHAGSSVSFSWYLTPRQHAAELMALNLVVIPLLVWLARRYTRAVGIKARPVDQMGWPLWLLDQAVHFTGLITLGFTLWYKYEKDAFVFMLQP